MCNFSKSIWCWPWNTNAILGVVQIQNGVRASGGHYYHRVNNNGKIPSANTSLPSHPHSVRIWLFLFNNNFMMWNFTNFTNHNVTSKTIISCKFFVKVSENSKSQMSDHLKTVAFIAGKKKSSNPNFFHSIFHWKVHCKHQFVCIKLA